MGAMRERRARRGQTSRWHHEISLDWRVLTGADTFAEGSNIGGKGGAVC